LRGTPEREDEEVRKETERANRNGLITTMVNYIVSHPFFVFPLSFIVLWLSAHIGAFFRSRLPPLAEEQRQDFSVLQGAILTLLSLLIGFTFSMGISRYDLRKNYEEAEANAIGTEYVRSDLLPGSDLAEVRELLRNYVDQRVLFYTTRDAQQLRQLNTDTAQLQNRLWSAVKTRSESQPTPIVALAVSGMNDVLNSQGFTQAAWWNHIPVAAWILMVLIAVGCNVLVGFGSRRPNSLLFILLPLAVSVSFFLLADLDSPRGGMIRVQPKNLLILSQSLRTH
jgi:hypothetical protein